MTHRHVYRIVHHQTLMHVRIQRARKHVLMCAHLHRLHVYMQTKWCRFQKVRSAQREENVSVAPSCHLPFLVINTCKHERTHTCTHTQTHTRTHSGYWTVEVNTSRLVQHDFSHDQQPMPMIRAKHSGTFVGCPFGEAGCPGGGEETTALCAHGYQYVRFDNLANRMKETMPQVHW